MQKSFLGYELSNQLQETISQVREFVDNKIIPLEPQLSTGSFSDLEPKLKTLREEVKELGLWLPQIPEEYGGMGLSLLEFGFIGETLGRSPLGHYVFNCQAPDAGNMEILIDHGTDDQKEKYLYPLLRGNIRSCFSIVEPDYPGSNPTWIGTTAEKEGDEYIINGEKWFSTGADGSAFAIVMAITNPEEKKHKRASQIIVPTDTDGFNLVRNIPVMGHTGDGWMSHGEITYDNCRVPQSNLLGSEGEGFIIAQERLGPGRIHHCMRWIGIAERAFDMMCEYSLSRKVAPDTPLASQQTIRTWIAESRAEINRSRLLVLDTAHKIDRIGQYRARDAVSMIKWEVANMLQKVIDRSIQVHGALGMTSDTPLAHWYAHERAARIYDGPDEVHKRSVSRRILRRYQEKGGQTHND